MAVASNERIQSLATQLAQFAELPSSLTLDVIRQITQQICTRHDAGRLHLQISADVVSLDSDNGRAELHEPPNASRSFGGMDCNDEFCPPELQRSGEVLVPVGLAVAHEALRAAGLSSVDPRRIDVYQLGTLLCRMLTGQSVSDYLSRPRVAAKVPPEARDLIERALGHDSQRAFRAADELLRALETLDASATVASPKLAGSTRNDAKPDTTPSFVNVGKADTDVGRPTPLPSKEDSLPFQKLGHYEIVGRLGRGGMGDVYKGYERRLDRYVAIKVLPADFSRQDEMVRRFNAEASAAAKLVHPNTVEIFFIGEDAGPAVEGQSPSAVHFFAMQFVDGESLAELLARRKRLSVAETLAITEQMLAGLDAAHRLGMVHRDIKPGNILIDRQRQRVQLADFGLVKSLQGSGMTASGVIVGTADYMAPEQGRGAAVDARADLYAVGVVLYQMLSGRLPFKADTVTAMIFQHVYETPPPLHEVATDIPEALAAIIAKLLSKPPDARYPDVGALHADLRAFRAGETLPSVSVERRSAVIQAPAFDEMLLPAELLEAPSVDWWHRTKDRALSLFRRHAPEALLRLQNTHQQVDGAIAEYERRQRKLLPLVNEAEAVLAELHAQESAWTTETATSSDAPPQSLEDLRQAIEQQQQQLSSMRLRLDQINATLSRLQSQRDLLNARLKVAHAQLQFGGAVVPSSRRSTTRTWEVKAQLTVVVGLIVFGGYLMFAHLFERNSKESITNSSAPGAVDVAAANAELETPVLPVRQFAQHRSLVGGVAFDSKGTLLAARDHEGMIHLWDAERGTEVASFRNEKPRNLQFDRLGVGVLSFSASGRWLLSSSSDSPVFRAVIIKIWDMETKSFAKNLVSQKHIVIAAQFSPDESSVVAVVSESAEGTTKELVRWSLETGEETQRLLLSNDVLGQVQFSSDGTRLAGVLPNGNVGLWDVAEGKLEKSLPAASPDAKKGVWVSALAFDADCSRLAVGTSAGDVSIWSIANGSLLQRYDGFGQQVATLSFSPRNRLLVGLFNYLDANQGEARIIDLTLGRVRRRLRGHAVHAGAYSPDGHWIATGGSQPFLILWDGALPPVEIPTPVREETMTGQSRLAVAVDGKSWIVATDHEKPKFQKEGSSEWRIGSAALGSSVYSVALSPDGRLAAIGEGRGAATLWKTDTGELLRQTRFSASRMSFDQGPDSYDAVRAIDFRTDNSQVLALCNGKLVSWDIESGNESVLFESVPKRVIAVSPDGQHLAAGGATGDLQLWNLGTRERVRSFVGHKNDVNCLSFSRDGRELLSGAGEDEVSLWNVETGEQIRRLSLPPPPPFIVGSGMSFLISSVKFSVDGKMIAVTGHGLISVFDSATGDELARLAGESGKAGQVGFLSDGQHLLSAATVRPSSTSANGLISRWAIKASSAK